MTVWHDLSLLAPVWILGIAAAVVLLLTVAGGKDQPAPAGSTHLTFVALAGVVAALWLLVRTVDGGSAFSGAILVDGLGIVFGGIALVGAAVAILLSTSYLDEHELAQGEFHALILLSTSGALVLAMAGDLMTLFIGVELMSLGVYVLAGYRRSSRRSQEAALKYFVYGAFASSFVIFGTALLYGEVGRLEGTASISLLAMSNAFAAGTVSPLGWIGVAMVLGGLGFKVAAVPFHMWAPDVYEGAPTPSTAFMAVAVKTGAIAGLCRFVAATLLAGGTSNETFVQILEIFAALTMVLGNLLAIRQTQIKRMLAYSSVAHAGYILVGVAAFVARPDSAALEAVAYYLFGYTAMTLGAFGVVLAFERRDDRRAGVAIERLLGTGHAYPALGLAMALFMFALAGIPPTTGFFGKLSLFSAAVHAGRIGIVIIAVLASAVGAFYYLRVGVVMYMRGTTSQEARVRSGWLTAGLWACAAVTVVVGVIPETYMGYVRRTLSSWLGV